MKKQNHKPQHKTKQKDKSKTKKMGSFMTMSPTHAGGGLSCSALLVGALQQRLLSPRRNLSVHICCVYSVSSYKALVIFQVPSFLHWFSLTLLGGECHFFSFCILGLGIQPRASHMLSASSACEPLPAHHSLQRQRNRGPEVEPLASLVSPLLWKELS